MTRRDFLRNAGLATAAAGLGGGAAWADDRDELRRFRITEITGFRHVCPRPKFIGKNSHLDVHGDTTAENCLRIATDQGIEGVGVGNLTARGGAVAGRHDPRSTLGARPGRHRADRPGRPCAVRPGRQGTRRAGLAD